VNCSRRLDLNPTDRIKRRGRSSPRVRVKVVAGELAHWNRFAGVVPAASGQRRGYDGLQHGEEISRGSTAPSISSGEGEEGRLEPSGGAELRVMDVELEMLRNKTN
jgi:hypothetical protein